LSAVSSDDPFPKLREIVESAPYREQIERIGSRQYFDIVVDTLIWGIVTNAEAFDPLPGFPELRMAMGAHPLRSVRLRSFSGSSTMSERNCYG
jgi:hypothetical protein